MDVLLINPPTCEIGDLPITRQLAAPAPPLGLVYLAAMLDEAGYTVEIVDMIPEGMRKEDLLTIIKKDCPLLVGISTVMINYNNSLKIAKSIKEYNPEIKVVLGGPHVSFIPAQALLNPFVDFVIVGEGEDTLVELAGFLKHGTPELEAINGLCFHKNGAFTSNAKRALREDLDSLPFPARDKLVLKNYLMPGTIITSRGCPSKCIFCAANKLYEGTCRFRSISNIIEEMDTLCKTYGITEFFIADDTFTASRKRVLEFCEHMIKLKANYTWVCESRIDTIDEHLLQKMRKAGCIKIQFGVESGVQQILDKIRKGIKLEDVEERVKAAVGLGLNVICSFIIGHPDDTQETVRETIAFAKKLKSFSTNEATVKNFFSLLTPLPGTYVYENLADLGVTLLSTNWDRYVFHHPVIRTKNLSEQELFNLYLQALSA